MRRDVVNRIESVIKDLWPTARVSVCRIYMYMGLCEHCSTLAHTTYNMWKETDDSDTWKPTNVRNESVQIYLC